LAAAGRRALHLRQTSLRPLLGQIKVSNALLHLQASHPRTRRKAPPGSPCRQVGGRVYAIAKFSSADPTLVDPFADDEPTDQWETVECDALRRISDLEKRTQRAWKVAEEAQIDPSQLRSRLAELDAQRRSAEVALNSARAARAMDAEHKQASRSFAELIEEFPDLWAQTTVELPQELARAFDAVLAESPAFGGLFADPSGRGNLIFRPVAKMRKAEFSRINPFSEDGG
jgi:hypothetical protein